MSAAEVAALVVAVASTIALCLLVAVVAWLARAVRALNTEVDHLRRETAATIEALQHAVGHAEAEMDRTDGLLDAAERISAAAESRARLTSDALSTPVIKALAIAAGTNRAAQRLRRTS
jgi:thiamine monophosphate kinase